VLSPPNPVAVPEFVIVAPEGTVNVSPESPNVKAVPVAGEILFVFTSSVTVNPAPVGTVIVSPDVPISRAVPVDGSTLFTFIKLIYTTTNVDPEGIVNVPVIVTGPAAIALELAETVILL